MPEREYLRESAFVAVLYIILQTNLLSKWGSYVVPTFGKIVTEK